MLDKGLINVIKKLQFSSYKIDGEIVSRTVHIQNQLETKAYILLVRHLVAHRLPPFCSTLF